jgi:diguanylate cyclase (GGDEF)-like protein
MKNWVVTFATLILSACPGVTAQSVPLTSLHQIHVLSNERAAQRIPVEFEATVTYYRDYERTLFVQEGSDGIYVQGTGEFKLGPGDRVRIQGSTRDSFHPIVFANSITVIRHDDLPPAPVATFTDLSHARYDSLLVQVRARILAADVTVSSDRPSTRMNILVDGAPADVQLDNTDAGALSGLLDADVVITGIASGIFDGKMEMTGVLIHVSSLEDVKVLKNSSENPWAVPLTPIDQLFSSFDENSESRRIRVKGVITYYFPGSNVVLQDGARSIWINTHTREHFAVGKAAEATGFPDVHDGFLRLANGEIRATERSTPIVPVNANWAELAQSHYIFNIVSIDAQVVAEVREAARDVYVLSNEGHLFSAVYRHPEQRAFRAVPLAPLKDIPVGSTVRATGICLVEDPNPYNGAVPVDLLMRSSDDIAVIRRPSLITVGNLLRLVVLLAVAILLAAVWVSLLRRRIRRQSQTLATRAADEAAHERHNAQIEQRRSSILEDINGTRPLAEILEEITSMVSFSLRGEPSWCEINDGARLGQVHAATAGTRLERQEIGARSGPPLGALFVLLDANEPPSEAQRQAMINGARLATLAVETRRLYSDLVHRSEFDLLTDVHNRFSLDKQLQTIIPYARQNAGIFGLIFVDLDDFKQVNDVHGHRIGDHYLQEVAARMKRQLRAGDLLARLGGDEFAVLVPTARARHDVEDIASRLRHCFDADFEMEHGIVLHGTASVGVALYPEDGYSADSLLSAADAAMYVAKNTRRELIPDEDGQASPPSVRS